MDLSMNDFTIDELIHVYHCGGRSGLHDSFKSYQGPMKYTSFEPSADAFEKLKQEVISTTNIAFEVLPFALDKIEQNISLNLYNMGDLNSVYEFDHQSSNRYRFKPIKFEGTREVEARTIDQVAADYSDEPDYLVLDTQGAELSILSGSVNSLNNSIVGIRCEVEFFPLYKDQPLFGHVQEFLVDNDFKLVRFETPGKRELGVSYDSGPFSLEKYDAAPAWADAIFILREESLLKINCDKLFVKKSLKWIMFCMLNSSISQVYDLLYKMNEHKRLCSFFSNIDNKIKKELIYCLIQRLRKINDSTWQTQSDIDHIYKNIRESFELILKQHL
jgi:FkbM family methyltransferase